MPRATAKQRPQTVTQRPSWPVRIGVALSICLVGAQFSGLGSWWVDTQIRSSLAARNVELAEGWLAWSAWLGMSRGEQLFWQARIARKQLLGTDALPLLQRAREAGFSPLRIERELLLLRAHAGDIRSVRAELDRLLLDPQEDGAEICEAYVNGALIDGESELALTILPVWESEFPNDGQPHYARGRLFEHRFAADTAEEQYRIAVSKSPQLWPARFALGRLLLSKNRVEAAAEQFLAARACRWNAAPRWGLARCWRAKGQLQQALTELKQLAALPTEDVQASFQRMGEPTWGLPIEHELGTLLAAQGENAEALPWLEKVLAVDAQNLEAKYALSGVLRAMGRKSEADAALMEVQASRKALEEADRLVDLVQRHPGEPYLAERCRIGELFLKHENRRRGEFWLKEVLHRDPTYAPAHALLADHYQQLAASQSVYQALADHHRRAAATPSAVPNGSTSLAKPDFLDESPPSNSPVEPSSASSPATDATSP
jgi:tetratricopeptide (TPR) repeat protein